jgi:hypothetical protein
LFNAKKIRNGKPEIVESDLKEEVVEVQIWTYVTVSESPFAHPSPQNRSVGNEGPMLLSERTLEIVAIAVGVILFPIMFSIGVPKNIAVSVFTIAIGAAMYVNNVHKSL